MKTVPELLHRWLAAWNAGDVEGLLACYADDFEYRDPNLAAPIRGDKEKLRRHLARIYELYPEQQWEPDGVYPHKAARAYSLTYRYRIRVPSTGKALEGRGMDLIILNPRGESPDEDRIAVNEVHLDTRGWRELLVL